MRLIHVSTRQIEEFIDSRVPEYAILSHTWEDGEELTHQDFLAKSRITSRGYKKVDMACQLAYRQDLSYVWVDTCCIDKTSSAELSEAINSMFRWYQSAKVCFVYLADLESGAWDTWSQCRWFTRGWTLQELIAPQRMLFFDSDWRTRPQGSTKVDMIRELSRVTNVNSRLLDGSRPLSSFSIAQKMSWAADRETTRIEDRAYSLLGIFELNMPLIYGEEHRAFYRLQETIIQSTPDLSILAWTMSPVLDQLWRSPHFPAMHDDLFELGPKPAPTPQEPIVSGVLAASPAEFLGCGNCERFAMHEESLCGFTISNIGICISSRLFLAPAPNDPFWILPLNLQVLGTSIGIRLRQIGSQYFVRNEPGLLLGWNVSLLSSPRVDRYLLSKVPLENFEWSNERYRSTRSTLCALRKHAVSFARLAKHELSNPWPAHRYHQEDQVFFVAQNTWWEFATIDLEVCYGSTVDEGISSDLVCQCKVIALGWAEPSAQFSIVADEDLQKVDTIQNRVSEWNTNQRALSAAFRSEDIPRTLSLLREVANNTFCELTLLPRQLFTNQHIASRSCYVVDLSIQIYSEQEARERQPIAMRWQ